MDGIQEFLKLFGGFTIRSLVELFLAIGFLVIIYKKIKKFLDEQYEHQAKEKEKDKARIQKLEDITTKIETFSTKQDNILSQQKEIKEKIEDIVRKQNTQQAQLDEIRKSVNEREKNKLNDKLVQSYSYYNSLEKNPLKAWTSMESSAFWGLFSEYEKAGGDGFMHEIVQPAMKVLRVIDINNSEEVANLMQSRR